MTDWPFEDDAARDDPLTAQRIAVVRSSHPMWCYIVAYLDVDPGPYRMGSAERPTDIPTTEGTTMTVTPAVLSSAMHDALTVIRTGKVTYRFRPLRRSTRRPLPITPLDLTPVYSHGLHAATVAALECRGLVRLSPYSPDHGCVLPVDTEGA